MARRPIMVMGCTSDAGKSLLTTALCRHFADRGLRVAPFKAQNMSTNAAVTPDGLEIGRAQYVQALAARTPPWQQGEDLHGQIREWLARDGTASSGWDVPKTIPAAKVILAERFAKLGGLLDVVAPAISVGGTIAVPDSSALLDAPEFERYPDALGVVHLDIYLVPGVLSELDALKDQGRTQEVREKARAAGLAIKRVRQHGSLLQGVEVAAGLRVFSRPTEPRVEGLPGALDPASPDDRILASAFELQREHPTSAVVLVTGDINLRTKAELAQLPFAEPPTRDGA